MAANSFHGCGGTEDKRLLVAVSSNFSGAAEEIANRFEARSGHQVTLLVGSTGKHFAQIKQGAPVDVFLSADARHPALLAEELDPGGPGPETYAYGRLVLWSPDRDLVDDEGNVLRAARFRRLAIANPRLAPYGKAAAETIESLGLGSALEGRIVRGENVEQAIQFVISGNADLGFVAYSQLKGAGGIKSGSVWIVPADLYQPIEQKALVLTNKAGGREFTDFLKSPAAVEVIRNYGYETP